MDFFVTNLNNIKNKKTQYECEILFYYELGKYEHDEIINLLKQLKISPDY